MTNGVSTKNAHTEDEPMIIHQSIDGRGLTRSELKELNKDSLIDLILILNIRLHDLKERYDDVKSQYELADSTIPGGQLKACHYGES